jgi:tripartite-type tricarboxylate transporter receptor subunit TctC
VFATNALVAAGGTPAAAVQRINQAVVRYLELPAARELFLAAGLEAVFSTPEQLTALMKAEMETAGKVIRSMDIRRN